MKNIKIKDIGDFTSISNQDKITSVKIIFPSRLRYSLRESNDRFYYHDHIWENNNDSDYWILGSEVERVVEDNKGKTAEEIGELTVEMIKRTNLGNK